MVAAGDQPTVDGGHTSGGGGGSLEESLSGNDLEKMTSLFTLVILCKCGETMNEPQNNELHHHFYVNKEKVQKVVTLFFPPLFCVRRLPWQELEMATRVKYSNFKGL